MRTGCRACDANRSETLPRRALRKGPRPRWPQTIRRAEISSATSKMALAMPSKDSLVNAVATYPCSVAWRAPFLRHLAGRGFFLLVQVGPPGSKAGSEGTRESQAGGDRLPDREHDCVHRSLEQVRSRSHGVA